jgi:alpha-galactosidase
MFRASDCPNSYVANRVKTTDVRLLAGTTAVHADMIMWHYGEPVEVAALQMLNILFSVPQLSVRLEEIPKDHFEMIRFYTGYWTANRKVLLDGAFEAPSPTSNYPLLAGHAGDKQIVAVYDDVVVRLDRRRPTGKIDVVNARPGRQVVLGVEDDLGDYRFTVLDCRGRTVTSGRTRLAKGVATFDVPPSGMLALERTP